MTVAASMIGAGEAARALGISTQYLSELAKAGRVEFEVTPYGRVYDPRDIEALREQRKVLASARAEAA